MATFLVALAGLGVSIYLTIAHFTESTLAGCSETGLVNCTKVTTSPQSYVFGIPVAVLGLAFYLFAVVIMSPWAWQASRREIHILRMASVVVGIGFVLYLIYAELFIIGSICLYCTSVHALTFVIFVLTAFAAAAWGLKPGKAWKPRLPRSSSAGSAARRWLGRSLTSRAVQVGRFRPRWLRPRWLRPPRFRPLLRDAWRSPRFPTGPPPRPDRPGQPAWPPVQPMPG